MCISIATHAKSGNYLCRVEIYGQYFFVALKDFEWAQKALWATYRDYKYSFYQNEIGLYVLRDNNLQDIDVANEIIIKDLTGNKYDFKESVINNNIIARLGYHAMMFTENRKAKQLAHYRYRFPIIPGNIKLIGHNGDIVSNNFVLPKPEFLIDNLEEFFQDTETFSEYKRIYDDLINPITFDFELGKTADYIFKRRQEICNCTPAYYCTHNIIAYFRIEKRQVKYIKTVNEIGEKPAQDNEIKFPVPTVPFTAKELKAFILNEVEIIDREKLGLSY